MRFLRSALSCAALAASAGIVHAQTTEITYQGRLQDTGSPVNGSFDFEFRLFLEPAGGAPLATVQRPGVAVANGLFTVVLDFGAQFTGAARHLEIATRPAGGGGFTTIGPRQPLTSAPHAIRSGVAGSADALSPACVSCVTNAHVLSLAGSKITGTVPVAALPPGSSFYIPNALPGTGTFGFDIGGDGSVGGTLHGEAVDSETGFTIGGQRVLAIGGASVGIDGTYLGVSAGAATTGALNTFVGARAGRLTTTGFGNVMVGVSAGEANTSGQGSTFVGTSSGSSNSIGADNTFLGQAAGASVTTSSRNTYVGSRAGQQAQTGGNGVAVGYEAGYSDRSGNNTFVGTQAGRLNSNGAFNTFVGYRAGFATDAASNTFVGYLAGTENLTGTANTFVGDLAGSANTTASRNTALGRRAGEAVTTASDNTMLGAAAGFLTTGADNTFVGAAAGQTNLAGHHNTAIGSGADYASGALQYATAVGADALVSTSNSLVLGRGSDTVRVPGVLVVSQLGAAGATALCRNASSQIASCSSSRRYKHDVERFPRGLDLVARLRPVRFRWNADDAPDLGFVAEEVAAAEPLLATRNADGQVEGVKYEQLGAVLVNAIQEQQRQLDALLAIVCSDHPDHAACRRREHEGGTR